MKANCKRVVILALRAVILGLLIQLSFPFIGGVYYSTCGDRGLEQAYLDRCIAHLQIMRVVCSDPDLQGILDYTIRRYRRIGAWDVMVMPLHSIGGKIIGCNCPWCPGITLDTSLLLWPPEDTALIVAHEAMHDYYPFFGHGHINAREEKLYRLSYQVRF